MKRQQAEMGDKMKKLMEQMHVGTMHPTNKGPIFVGKHYGISDLSGFQNGSPQGPARTSLFKGAQATPMSSRYLPSYPVTPNIMTPMPQEGFAPWSSPYQATVDVECNESGKENSLSEHVLLESVYELAESKNKARNGKAPAFDLGNADLDDNVGVNEVLIMATRATVNYICYKNMDPNK
ncbi:hypothetical protein Tco_1454235, partial [Tanacetum coccineum]